MTNRLRPSPVRGWTICLHADLREHQPRRLRGCQLEDTEYGGRDDLPRAERGRPDLVAAVVLTGYSCGVPFIVAGGPVGIDGDGLVVDTVG